MPWTAPRASTPWPCARTSGTPSRRRATRWRGRERKRKTRRTARTGRRGERATSRGARRRGVARPDPPESDEVAVKGEEKDNKKDSKDGKKALEIDFEGLGERVARVPVPFDNYSSLAAVPGKLLFMKNPAFAFGREPSRQPAPEVHDLAGRQGEAPGGAAGGRGAAPG